MRAHVEVRVVVRGTDEQRVSLGHGDFVGRLGTAALVLDDLGVSEAHAMVSLRNGGLQLLALRRRFRVGGVPLSEVQLRAGLTVDLTPDIQLVVEAVRLPDAVIGLRWEGGEVALLHDSVAIVTTPTVEVLWRSEDPAAVRLWRVGGTWSRQGADQREHIGLGDVFEVGGVDFEVVEVPLVSDVEQTRSPEQPLRLVAFWDTVHLHRGGRPPTVLSGHGARLISELAVTGVPVSWPVMARQLWTDSGEERVLRRRLDAVLARTRKKLVDAGFRSDLVAYDGVGHLELRLGPNDTVDDRT